MTGNIRKHQLSSYFHSSKNGCSWPWASLKLQDKMVRRNTRWPLLHLPTGEDWNLHFSIRTNTIAIFPITILSFLYCYEDISCKYWTGLSKNPISFTEQSEMPENPFQLQMRLKLSWTQQIENLLKTIQQSMQLVSILVLKNIKSISKEIFRKGFFQKIFWDFFELFTANC